MSEADFFAYLTGNTADAGNELGLDILQPERLMIDAERENFSANPRSNWAWLPLDPTDRF